MCVCVWVVGFFAADAKNLDALNGGDLAKHDNSVALHDGNAAETFTVLEGVDNKRLLGFKNALRNLVRLEIPK